MEIEIYIRKMKDIHQSILDLIDATDDYDSHFLNLTGKLDKYNITQDKKQTKELLRLISKISSNHHQTTNFFNKLAKIFQYIINDKKAPITTSEILQTFETSKKFLLFLFSNKILTPDESTLNLILAKPNYRHYLYNGIKTYIDKSKALQIEKEITEQYDDDIETFSNKCLTGENDSIICSLIRQDSIDAFVTFLNENSISFSDTITPSRYETNPFLIGKKISFIEYAAFFGSIQIFQYLQSNQVKLNDFLWIYAVHSNKLELIHMIEPLIKLDDKKIEFVLKEAIKCHHNEIANYILHNLMKMEKIGENYESTVLDSYNYYFFPSDISYIFTKPKNRNGFNVANLGFLCETITIHSSVNLIEKFVFQGCSFLVEVKIPFSLTSIENNAFEYCTSLKKVTFLMKPSSKKVAFEIPSSLKKIGNNVFYGCSALTSITIPSSVTSIGYCAFYGCSSLKNIEILSPKTIISPSAFNGCSSLIKQP